MAVPTSMTMPMPVHTISSESVHITAPAPLLLSAPPPTAMAMPEPTPTEVARASHQCNIKFGAKDMYDNAIPGFASKDVGKSEPITTFSETLDGLAKKLVEASGLVLASDMDPKNVFIADNLMFVFDGAPYVKTEVNPADALWTTAKDVYITFLLPPQKCNGSGSRQQVHDARSTIVYRRKVYRSRMSKLKKDMEAFEKLKASAPIWAMPKYITSTK
ncbi:hypothetical protein GGI00_002467 [Coemansia sp. RSA 2681]|nr:hypothetical protein GGI00_002467 [Coemansia sp. RSA 2681]